MGAELASLKVQLRSAIIYEDREGLSNTIRLGKISYIIDAFLKGVNNVALSLSVALSLYSPPNPVPLARHFSILASSVDRDDNVDPVSRN